MKRLVSFLIFFPFISLLADDISDAKIAFETLVKYQKQDDIRSLDLFSKHCLIVFKVIDDKLQTNIVVIPTEAFRMSLKKEIEQKRGNKNEYRNVQYSSDDFSVTVTANIFNPDSAKENSFMAKYGRDNDGIMKIEEVRTTIFKNFKSQQVH